MELIAFTTYADIRAIVGLSAKELPDEDLALESYIFGLQESLGAVSSTLEADYTSASANMSADSYTDSEQSLYRATRLFAAAQVSLAVAYSLPMRANKAITDGKAGLSRFTDSPFRDTVENLKGLFASAKANLETVYASYKGLDSTTVVSLPSFVRAVSPSVDPVTG